MEAHWHGENIAVADQPNIVDRFAVGPDTLATLDSRTRVSTFHAVAEDLLESWFQVVLETMGQA